ncbi:hypothetical protein ACI65C_010030 [Semiaphis heraclei]
MVMTLIKQDVESNLSGDTAMAANVVISCIIYMSAVFVVSLVIKLSLRTCQDRLTFVSHADDAIYHLTSLSMEIVEITEQYCYTMNIGIILKLYILSGKLTVVILLKLICNHLIKLTTNSCAYYVFRTNLVFVIYHVSPSALSIVTKLANFIIQLEHSRRGKCTTSHPDIINNYTKSLRYAVKQDLYQGVNVLRSIVALIASSYISNRCTLALWSVNVLDTKTAFFKTRCARNLKRADTLDAATREAVITFAYLAMQLGLREVCKYLRVSKNLLTSFVLMYINMTVFRYTGVMMNPTYSMALTYGCPGKINRDHFIVFWIGPIVGVLVFKDVVKITKIMFDMMYVFQASIDDLHNFGTLKTLHAIVEDNNRERCNESEQKEVQLRFRSQKDERKPSNDEQFTREYVSLEKKIQMYKQKEEDIDSIIEKCTADGEHLAIRRETEKNYVDKWEKARIEHFKFKFKSEELELQKYIADLQTKMKTDEIVDEENEKFLDYTIKELEKQIEYWECKYKTDTKEIDEKLENLIMTLEEKTKEIESLKKTFNERQTIIEEHAENKQRVEEERKLNDHMEKMATKIQAWWRGTMVRRRLGPYKHLSGPRKKSIKKPLINKGKKTKGK